MSENTKPVTDETFDTDVLKATGPVLVDFWAEWCGPCKMIGPALEEIAGELAGKLTVAKVNIDDNPMTPNAYAVRGIPGRRAAEKPAEGLDLQQPVGGEGCRSAPRLRGGFCCQIAFRRELYT